MKLISVPFSYFSIHPLILINWIHLSVCWSLSSVGFLKKLPCEQYFLNFWILKAIVVSACLQILYLRIAYLLKLICKPTSTLAVSCSPWWMCAVWIGLSPGAHIPAQGQHGGAFPSCSSSHLAIYLAPSLFCIYVLFLVISLFKMAPKHSNEVLSSIFKCKKAVKYFLEKITCVGEASFKHKLYAVGYEFNVI